MLRYDTTEFDRVQLIPDVSAKTVEDKTCTMCYSRISSIEVAVLIAYFVSSKNIKNLRFLSKLNQMYHSSPLIVHIAMKHPY